MLYAIGRRRLQRQGLPIRDLMNKTEELCAGTSRLKVESDPSMYKIDEDTLQALKKDGGSDSAKIVNLARSLATAVKNTEDDQPHLIPIGDRAEEILHLFEDRQLEPSMHSKNWRRRSLNTTPRNEKSKSAAST